MNESYFDGNIIQQIFYTILAILLTLFTAGLAGPWATCMLINWETKHTVINGRRLEFDGTGTQLFGNYIIWFLLTFITLGIYSFWFKLNMKKWITKHTHMI